MSFHAAWPMSGFLLDKNVVSELRKGDRANAGVVAWADEKAEARRWLSVLVVGEPRRVRAAGVARPRWRSRTRELAWSRDE